MIHIDIQGSLNGKPVDWMEKVSDQQYQLGPRSSSLVIRYQLFVIEQKRKTEALTVVSLRLS
jgi:hypothetical protein